MAGSFLITLREGFEAALIVAIVMAYLRQVGRADAFRYVWIGTAAALGVSFVVGVVAWSMLGGLTGGLRRLVFGAICLAAVAVLTWMIFWMKRQARSLSRELREQVDRTLRHGGSTLGIAAIPFVAVLREGIETVLFLLAILAGTSPRDFAVGGVLGLAGAVVLGVLVYQSGRRLNLRAFFTLTGFLVLLIAAGLCARGVAWLQEAAVLPTFWWPVWDVHLNPIVGYGTLAQFLSGLLGWNPQPSIEEVSAWVVYLLVTGWFFTGGVSWTRGAAAAPRPAATAAGAAVSR
jgi:high-affinity iron transporter